MKWMMGWMHDTLDFFKLDPIYRQFQQDKFSFSMVYFQDENFMLPLSHDEVVHGKSPMIYKMPGDEWQKFANLRLLYTYMFTHPGAKLLFMGDEFGATTEWNYKSELPWHLLQYVSHEGMKHCVQQLNNLYKSQPALYQKQFSTEGFEWVDLNHRAEGVVVYKRKGNSPDDDVVIILNMTPLVREHWTIYVHNKAEWKVVFNSDKKEYWGSGHVYNADIHSELVDEPSKCYKLQIHLPPLAGVVIG
jgi:1,4-alpha-glucan branching enzyme